MRHLIPFTSVLVLSGVFNLGCNTTPVEPAETQGVSTVPVAHPPATLPSASAQTAVIIRDRGCSLIDGDGEVIFADRDFTLSTESTGLNTMLVCKVKNVANSTEETLRYTTDHNPFGPGLVCFVVRPEFTVATGDWTESISASGNGTLRCRVKL